LLRDVLIIQGHLLLEQGDYCMYEAPQPIAFRS
jgi:hypothetical protein